MGLAIIEGGLGPAPSGVEVMESADRRLGGNNLVDARPTSEWCSFRCHR